MTRGSSYFESGCMKFLVLTDIHGNEDVSAWANKIIEDKGADFVIILGDITQFGPKAGQRISLLHLKFQSML